jgi:hypothetical protein
MRLIKILVFSLFLIVPATAGFAQDQDAYDYESEFTWGINKNTSGGLIGGFMFKKSFKMSDRQLQTFGLEIMNVKHPQEVRYNSQYGNFSRSVKRTICMHCAFNTVAILSYLKKLRSKALK